MRSLQESLMEEILASDDQISFPSFTTTDRNTPSQNLQSDIHSSHFPTSRNKSSRHPKNVSSITDLEDQILRMRAAVTRSHKKTPFDAQISESKTSKQKIKTQASDNIIQQYENKSASQKKRVSSLQNSVYERSFQHESKHKQWKKQKLQERHSVEMSKCTHRPQMSQGSRMISSKIDRQSLYERQKQNKQRKIQSIKRQEERKALEECVFTPNLKKGRKSSKDLKSIDVSDFEKKSNQSVFDCLYEESKIRQMKQRKKQIQSIQSLILKPKVDPISSQIVGNLSFEQRRKIYEKKRLQKQIQRKEQVEKQNCILYKPKINSYYVNRNPDISIGDHLYSQSKKVPISNKITKKESMVNKKSQQVYQERKIIAFYQIFKLLDGDQDGVICSQDMNLEILPRQIVKIIYPLIDELDTLDVQLEEHEFIQSLHNLFQTLTIHERNIILGFTPSPKQQQQPSFQPKINPRSKQIAEQMHRNHLDISQFCTIREAERQKHLQTERLEKSKKEMQKCTFRPQIITRFRY